MERSECRNQNDFVYIQGGELQGKESEEIAQVDGNKHQKFTVFVGLGAVDHTGQNNIVSANIVIGIGKQEGNNRDSHGNQDEIESFQKFQALLPHHHSSAPFLKISIWHTLPIAFYHV